MVESWTFSLLQMACECRTTSFGFALLSIAAVLSCYLIIKFADIFYTTVSASIWKICFYDNFLLSVIELTCFMLAFDLIPVRVVLT